jgi:hypothetical protein
MQMIEVTNENLAITFIEVSVNLYKNDPNYIRPLDKDIHEVFDPNKNKAFRDGKIIRWVLKNQHGNLVGRIAAFIMNKYKNKGDLVPVGCIGFFDCINDQPTANLLFDTAKAWLQSQGAEAMDGPVNFGERDKWWGLLVEGYHAPLYCMNYNFPYYKDLFESYGFQVFFYQNCYSRKVRGKLDDRFYKGHKRLEERGGFVAKMIELDKLEQYAKDFVKVYNSAWAGHEGNKEMSEEAAIKLFNAMKPILDPRIAWFTYYKEEPIALYVSIPDLNMAFKEFNGQFGLWQKLKFLYYKKTGRFNKMVGIIFGVVPRFQALGVDYFMIVEAAKVIQFKTHYLETELQWQGDFNPKMNNVSKHLGFTNSRRLATYRYLFNRELPFERHPIL